MTVHRHEYHSSRQCQCIGFALASSGVASISEEGLREGVEVGGMWWDWRARLVECGGVVLVFSSVVYLI